VTAQRSLSAREELRAEVERIIIRRLACGESALIAGNAEHLVRALFEDGRKVENIDLTARNGISNGAYDYVVSLGRYDFATFETTAHSICDIAAARGRFVLDIVSDDDAIVARLGAWADTVGAAIVAVNPVGELSAMPPDLSRWLGGTIASGVAWGNFLEWLRAAVGLGMLVVLESELCAYLSSNVACRLMVCFENAPGPEQNARIVALDQAKAAALEHGLVAALTAHDARAAGEVKAKLATALTSDANRIAFARICLAAHAVAGRPVLEELAPDGFLDGLRPLMDAAVRDLSVAHAMDAIVRDPILASSFMAHGVSIAEIPSALARMRLASAG
jgi:predicted nucleic acid-binding protein